MIKKKLHLESIIRTHFEGNRNIEGALYLDRNERSIPFSENLFQKIIENISKQNLCAYPNIASFYKKLASWHKMDENNFFITEGVSGGIKNILESICNKNDKVIFPVPGFSLYSVYANIFNLNSVKVPYNENYKLNLNDIVKEIDNNTSVVFIPNPNHPIEGILNIDEIKIIAKKCLNHGSLLAIDEVYYPFYNNSSIKLIHEFKNILVLRSFSKAFGLASIRLGYIIGNKDIVSYISKIRSGYETNSLSITIANTIIENYNEVEDYVLEVKQALDYLMNKFDTLDIEYTGGENSNFLFVNLKNDKLLDFITKGLEQKKNLY